MQFSDKIIDLKYLFLKRKKKSEENSRTQNDDQINTDDIEQLKQTIQDQNEMINSLKQEISSRTDQNLDIINPT